MCERTLPNWPDHVRAAPNAFLRSALFSATSEREFLKDEKLASVGNLEITFRGYRLDQHDFDVFQQILHCAQCSDLERPFFVTSYRLLSLLCITDTGKNRLILDERIKRLAEARLNLKTGKYLYIGSLIHSAMRDEKTKIWRILLNKDLLPLFADDQYTRINYDLRAQLSRNQTAKWLHAFYSSHKHPFPYKIETLHALCGSKSDLKEFKRALKKALNLIASESEKRNERFAFVIKNELVHVFH